MIHGFPFFFACVSQQERSDQMYCTGLKEMCLPICSDPVQGMMPHGRIEEGEQSSRAASDIVP